MILIISNKGKKKKGQNICLWLSKIFLTANQRKKIIIIIIINIFTYMYKYTSETKVSKDST